MARSFHRLSCVRHVSGGLVSIYLNLWRVVGRLVALAGLFALVSASLVGADSTAEMTWQIEIKTAFTAAEMRQPGWEQDARARETALAARLQARGTRLETMRAPKADGAEIVFRAEGSGTLAQFQRVAFDDLSVVGGLIGGSAILTLNGAVQRGENVSLALESNPSTGYAWAVRAANGVRANESTSFRQKASLPGAPAIQTIALNVAQDGDASLTLAYQRPWESFEPTRAITLTASRLATIAEIVNPRALAETPPPNLPVRAPERAAALPATFNWATSDNYLGAPKLTTIRNQGSCGSCWAFATVAAFEGNIYIKDNVSRDLSEQFLVSCNTDGWGCGGGWWGHKYHYNTTIPGDPNPGAVYESTFPYVAYDATCNAPYARPYRLNNWFYVESPWTIPSVDAIKNAIYNYGPVSVAVCAGPVFQSYRGGIYSTNESSYCNGGINHAVNLVGWNDAENTWILRNSWGTGWGESGYMRIARGVSNIGYNASYVVYNGATATFKNYLPLVLKSADASGWVTIMSEDFEGTFPGVWSLSYNANKNSGYLWGKRSCRPYAGTSSAWAVGGGTLGANLSCGAYYPNYVQTWMKYGSFSLANTSAAELRARVWTHTESPSYAFDIVFIGASINNYNFYGTLYYGDWNWNEQVLDFSNVYTLGNLLGQSNVWIAIVFDTDNSVAYTEGGYVDNVLLRKCPSGSTCPAGLASPMVNTNQFTRPTQMILAP
jgi:C1A family cysteine protease